jgi:hypothetical protein
VDLVSHQVLEPRACGVTEVERQVLDDESVVGRSPAWHASRLSSSQTLGLVSPPYLGTLVGARKREGNFASRML